MATLGLRLPVDQRAFLCNGELADIEHRCDLRIGKARAATAAKQLRTRARQRPAAFRLDDDQIIGSNRNQRRQLLRCTGFKFSH